MLIEDDGSLIILCNRRNCAVELMTSPNVPRPRNPALTPATKRACFFCDLFHGQVSGHGSITCLLLMSGILLAGDNSGYLR